MNYAQNRAVKGLPSPLAITATIDPASVPANTAAHEAFVVAGVIAGDIVLGMDTAELANLGITNPRVSATDEITVTFINTTAGALDLGTATWTFLIARPGQPGPGLS